jgi:regulatory protein
LINKSNLRDRALGLLARREHSCYELKRKLLTKGFSRAEIEAVLVALIEEGLQSDERYTESYVRNRVNMGFGPRRISLELHQRGIATSMINQYLTQDDEFWWAALSSLWQRKYHTKPAQDYGKQARFLVQRGFETQQVSRWLRSIFK